jgi:polysaccharide export outer membrane protein
VKQSSNIPRCEIKPRLTLVSVLRALLSVPVCLAIAVQPLTLSAQDPQSSAPVAAPAEDYRIGPGDVLSVTVADAPEFSGKFRVSDSGMLEITSVNDPVEALGLTPIELSHAIEKALRDARQLRNPKVHVFIEEYHGRTITILGSVSKPSVYSLTRRTTILDALSLAGGALPNSGNTVTIVRGEASAEATDAPVGSVRIIDVARLTRGEDLSANVEVRNGDVINVSPAQVVYVVGAVTKPGGYVLANPTDGVSVVQAVALAEGFQPLAATHRGLIIRQSTSEQGRREIAVDVQSIMNGKNTDLILAPNDILYIPESNGKKAVKVMTDIAMATVNGIAIYGIGYRIGNAHF